MSLVISDPSSRLLDVLRGVAAFLVVLGHSRDNAAKIFELSPTGASFFEKLLLVPSSFAMESVAVFFVLSGFLVGGQTVKLVSAQRFVWLDFFAKRLSRLWTVLIPGIIFTWLMWELCFSVWGYQLQAPSLNQALCNVFFLQESQCAPFSTNVALWSLSYEFWFYVLFAGMAAGVGYYYRRSYIAAALCLLLVVAVVAVFGVKVLYLFPGWLIGVLVYWLCSQQRETPTAVSQRAYLWLSLAVAAITLLSLVSAVFAWKKVELTLIMSLPSALFLYLALQVKTEPKILKPFIEIGCYLGQRSFSTYVFHMPVVVAVLLACEALFAQRNLSLALLTYFTSIISLLVTLVLWSITERHTPVFRKLALNLVASFRGTKPKLS